MLTRNASSPHSGCPGSVPYAKPIRSGSSTVHTTRQGITSRGRRSPGRLSRSRTVAPSSAGAYGWTAKPLPSWLPQPSTYRPARSRTSGPCPRWIRRRSCA